MTKILICGFGSIGKQHARNFTKLECEVAVWRERVEALVEIEEMGYKFFSDIEQGLQWCDGAIICVATNKHIALALKAAEARKAYYIEKPISHNFDGVKQLQEISEGLVVEVGCQLRQHPCLRSLKEQLDLDKGRILSFQAWVGYSLDQWRSGQDYRQGYSSDAKQGGGALNELVHEIDLVQWLCGTGDEIAADMRKVSDLELSCEDLVNIIMVTDDGACGTIQLDILSPGYRRGIEIITSTYSYYFDFSLGKLWRKKGHDQELIAEISDDYQNSQMLYDACENFVRRLQDNEEPACCSLHEGIDALNVIFHTRKANELGKRIKIEKALSYE